MYLRCVLGVLCFLLPHGASMSSNYFIYTSFPNMHMHYISRIFVIGVLLRHLHHPWLINILVLSNEKTWHIRVISILIQEIFEPLPPNVCDCDLHWFFFTLSSPCFHHPHQILLKGLQVALATSPTTNLTTLHVVHYTHRCTSHPWPSFDNRPTLLSFDSNQCHFLASTYPL